VSDKKPEYFIYTCPNCLSSRNAFAVAKELPREVLLRRTRPLIGSLRRKKLAGPGRPSLARCPGCSQEMSSQDLREHRMSCVRAELERLRGMEIQLEPKDPDPYPNFYLHHIGETEVEFRKGSNDDVVTVDLRKIADITVNHSDKKVAYVRVLGRVVWLDDIKRWRFAPTPIGRPPLERLA
jgi:hypothetical protein